MRATTGTGRTRPGGWVWFLGRLAVRTFYRVEQIGGPLPKGALLLVANHPNTLLDPAVIQATAGRPVRFLAKSTLFAGHPMSPLIRRSGAIPVYRKIDPDVDTSRNTEMFAAVEAALKAGEVICLFPEGISHSGGRLEPLRTGAARMALTSAADGHPVTIVPIGLNFDHVARFRSKVTAVFGRPLAAGDHLALHATDAAGAVRELTDRIAHRLRRLMVEAEPRHDLPVVVRIDRLYAAARGVSRDPREQVGRRRLIAEGMAQLRDRDPQRLASITARVNDYDASLTRFGLRERDVDRRIPFAAAARFVAREGLLALVLAPLALTGLAVFAVPYWLTGWINRRAPDLKSRAAWQVVGGALTYGAWIGALGGVVAGQAGAAAGGAAAAGLLVLAFAGVHAVEREAAVMRTVRAFFALRQTPLAARAALRRQRAALAAVLDQTHEWLEERVSRAPAAAGSPRRATAPTPGGLVERQAEPRGDDWRATRERPG